MGLGFGLVGVLFSSVFVRLVRQEYLARVSGITNALLMSMMPLMALVCSFLAVFLKVNVIFLLVGISNLLIYGFVAKADVFCMLDSNGNEDENE